MTTEPRRALPTQSAHPWRAVARTILAVIAGLALVLPIAWGILLDEVGRQGWTLPAPVVSVVAVILGVVAIISGAITRVMAIPQVDHLLRLIGLSAAPEPEPEPVIIPASWGETPADRGEPAGTDDDWDDSPGQP